MKSPAWRLQRRRADLRHFEIFRHGSIIIYTQLPAGGTYYPICTFPASSERLIGISDAFSAFCLPSSSPRAHCTSNKSVPTLRYTRRHGRRYTGPCPKALTECSPLDFRRSSIKRRRNKTINAAQRKTCTQSVWCVCVCVCVCIYMCVCVCVCVCSRWGREQGICQYRSRALVLVFIDGSVSDR